MLSKHLLFENQFIWYPKNGPKNGIALSGSIQPSSVGIANSLVNLFNNISELSIMTAMIEHDFQLLDKIDALQNSWFIYNITEVHPIVVESTNSTVLHKTLSLKTIPTRKLQKNYISNLFTTDKNESAISIIKNYFENKNITFIEQYEDLQEEPENFVLLTLNDFSYLAVWQQSQKVTIANMSLYAGGQKARETLFTFYQELCSILCELSSLIETSLKDSGVESPSLYFSVSPPQVEEFTLVNEYQPDSIMKMSLSLPFVKKVCESYFVRKITHTLKTRS